MSSSTIAIAISGHAHSRHRSASIFAAIAKSTVPIATPDSCNSR